MRRWKALRGRLQEEGHRLVESVGGAGTRGGHQDSACTIHKTNVGFGCMNMFLLIPLESCDLF